jgi:hypothetical protein
MMQQIIGEREKSHLSRKILINILRKRFVHTKQSKCKVLESYVLYFNLKLSEKKEHCEEISEKLINGYFSRTLKTHIECGNQREINA